MGVMAGEGILREGVALPTPESASENKHKKYKNHHPVKKKPIRIGWQGKVSSMIK